MKPPILLKATLNIMLYVLINRNYFIYIPFSYFKIYPLWISTIPSKWGIIQFCQSNRILYNWPNNFEPDYIYIHNN